MNIYTKSLRSSAQKKGKYLFFMSFLFPRNVHNEKATIDKF